MLDDDTLAVPPPPLLPLVLSSEPPCLLPLSCSASPRFQDFNTVWTTAVEMLDDDTFVVGENAYNLLVLRKVNDAATDEERARLEVVGQYHAGV